MKVFKSWENDRVQADIRELLYVCAKALTAMDTLGKTAAQGRRLEFERQRMEELDESQS